MSIADLDGDGKIEFSEFCNLMEALLKEKPRRKVIEMRLSRGG